MRTHTGRAAAANRCVVRAAGCLMILAAVSVLPMGVATADSITGFHTSSGNITCVTSDTTVTCEINEYRFDPPRRPDTCHQSFGARITLGGALPYFHCYGDTIRDPNLDTLEDGSVYVNGEITCSSAEPILMCTNRTTGHGFALAPGSYTFY